MAYDLIGTTARVHLYDASGILLGTLQGRVADVARGVEVAPGMQKDLAYLVDIEAGVGEDGEAVPYKNSAGGENEGWFALQDLEVVKTTQPRFFVN